MSISDIFSSSITRQNLTGDEPIISHNHSLETNLTMKLPSVYGFLFGVITVLLLPQSATAQGGGARARPVDSSNEVTPYNTKIANSHIMISGSSQIRVKPTQLRLIWAVIEEAEDAKLCHDLLKTQVEKTRSAVQALGVLESLIVEDFISAIPRFEYKVEEQENETVLIESAAGFRMQTNLHIAVESDEKALEVIDAAFKSGLNDLIGVDYTADVEEEKQKALQEALQAAKAKAQLLFADLVEESPAVINVQEKSVVFYPSNLYDSFENVARGSVSARYNTQLRRIDLYRPKNTYYKGLPRSADVKSYKLPMNAEIIIESKVVIYYQSPAAPGQKLNGAKGSK
jgi:uncharacterized protein YggE